MKTQINTNHECPKAGSSELAPKPQENAFVSYSIQRLKDGIKPITIKGDTRILKQLATLANINKPEEIKFALTQLPLKDSTKAKIVNTYTSYLKWKNIPFKKPKYNKTSELPFIPTENELDILIASCGKRLSTFLLTLKITGARAGELNKLQWQDIDLQRKTIHIKPEKNSNARILPITNELINAFNNLQRKHNKVFSKNLSSTRYYYNLKRKTTANKLNNPRLLKIGFHTFRHWKGTTEYHKTKDIMHVKYVLGHKNIQSTMTYITLDKALYQMTTDEWTTTVTHNIQEEQTAIQTGFELVRSINETTALYKKRK